MDAVARQARLHRAIGLGHRLVIIDEGEAVGAGIVGQPLIDCGDLRCGRHARAPGEGGGGRDGGDDDLDAVRAGEVGHGLDIAQHRFHRRRAGIAGDVVGHRHDVDGLRLQRDHVIAEPHQHLLRRLTADAAIDQPVLEHGRVQVDPVVGDGIAHEDDANLLTLDRLVGGGIAAQLPEIAGQHMQVPQLPAGLVARLLVGGAGIGDDADWIIGMRIARHLGFGEGRHGQRHRAGGGEKGGGETQHRRPHFLVPSACAIALAAIGAITA